MNSLNSLHLLEQSSQPNKVYSTGLLECPENKWVLSYVYPATPIKQNKKFHV